jgi:hypothetical protein
VWRQRDEISSNFVGIATFAEARADWRRRFLPLPGGIPATTPSGGSSRPSTPRRAGPVFAAALDDAYLSRLLAGVSPQQPPDHN